MLTERDVKIITHIEDFGYITISQCYTMFFKERKYGYDLARKRLAIIEKMGYIKSYIDYSCYGSEKIFFQNEKYKYQTKHNITIMNFYAELIAFGCEVLYFKKEQRWLDGKYRSDAYTVFKMDNYLYSICLEVMQSTSKKPYNEEREYINTKYTDIITDSENPLDIIEDIVGERINATTTLLVVDDIKHKLPWVVDDVKVNTTDFSLNSLAKILA